MIQRHVSEKVRDVYDALKTVHDGGGALPPEALAALLKLALTARVMAEEMEEELDIAERRLASHRPPANPQGDIVRLPLRPRLVASPPDGGDAA